MINDKTKFTQDTNLVAQYEEEWDMTVTVGVYSSNYRGFYGSTGKCQPNIIPVTGERLYSIGAETNFGSGVHIQVSATDSTSNPPTAGDYHVMRHNYKMTVLYDGRIYTVSVTKGSIYHYGSDAVKLYNAIIKAPEGSTFKVKWELA